MQESNSRSGLKVDSTTLNITMVKSWLQLCQSEFAGISRILEHRFKSTLCYGIPQTALDFLLLWQPDDDQQRRIVSRGMGFLPTLSQLVLGRMDRQSCLHIHFSLRKEQTTHAMARHGSMGRLSYQPDRSRRKFLLHGRRIKEIRKTSR